MASLCKEERKSLTEKFKSELGLGDTKKVHHDILCSYYLYLKIMLQ